MAVLVDLEQVAVRRVGRVLFEGLSFTVSDGDRIGVVGINGTGKSTLLRIVAGADQPDDGQVRRGRGSRWVFSSRCLSSSQALSGLPSAKDGKPKLP